MRSRYHCIWSAVLSIPGGHATALKSRHAARFLAVSDMPTSERGEKERAGSGSPSTRRLRAKCHHFRDNFLFRPHFRHRLRPCPGCTSCLVCIACENGNCKRRHLKTQHCDGSGVLPAKRHRRCGWWLKTRTAKNATERCGMPMTGGGWVDCQHCGGSGWLGEEQAR